MKWNLCKRPSALCEYSENSTAGMMVNGAGVLTSTRLGSPGIESLRPGCCRVLLALDSWMIESL